MTEKKLLVVLFIFCGLDSFSQQTKPYKDVKNSVVVLLDRLPNDGLCVSMTGFQTFFFSGEISWQTKQDLLDKKYPLGTHRVKNGEGKEVRTTHRVYEEFFDIKTELNYLVILKFEKEDIDCTSRYYGVGFGKNMHEALKNAEGHLITTSVRYNVQKDSYQIVFSESY